MSRLVPEELKKAQTDAVPTQRYGNIDDIANATVYLFSPAASYVCLPSPNRSCREVDD